MVCQVLHFKKQTNKKTAKLSENHCTTIHHLTSVLLTYFIWTANWIMADPFRQVGRDLICSWSSVTTQGECKVTWTTGRVLMARGKASLQMSAYSSRWVLLCKNLSWAVGSLNSLSTIIQLVAGVCLLFAGLWVVSQWVSVPHVARHRPDNSAGWEDQGDQASEEEA